MAARLLGEWAGSVHPGPLHLGLWCSLLQLCGDGLVEIVCNTIGPLDLKAVVSKRCERRCRQPRGCQLHARSGTCSLVQANTHGFPVVAMTAVVER